MNSHPDAVKIWRVKRFVSGVGEYEEMVVTAPSETRARELASAAAGTEPASEWTDASWSRAWIVGEPLGIRARVVERIVRVK